MTWDEAVKFWREEMGGECSDKCPAWGCCEIWDPVEECCCAWIVNETDDI